MTALSVDSLITKTSLPSCIAPGCDRWLARKHLTPTISRWKLKLLRHLRSQPPSVSKSLLLLLRTSAEGHYRPLLLSLFLSFFRRLLPSSRFHGGSVFSFRLRLYVSCTNSRSLSSFEFLFLFMLLWVLNDTGANDMRPFRSALLDRPYFLWMFFFVTLYYTVLYLIVDEQFLKLLRGN